MSTDLAALKSTGHLTSATALNSPPAHQHGIVQERRLRRIGLGVLVMVFGVFGIWAATAPLGSAAHGTGKIAVYSQRKAVQHLEGGIVKAVLVREGDVVERDQTLIELDEVQSRAHFDAQEAQSLALIAREARLVAERDGRTGISFPETILSRRDNPQIREAIQAQEQAFRARKSAQDGENSMYARQIESLQAKLSGLRAQRPSREATLKSYKSELDDFKVLLEQGYADKQKVRDLERNLDQSRAQLDGVISEISSTEAQVAELRLKQGQIQRDVQREIAKELAQAQADAAEIRSKMVALNDNVRRTLIKAPQAGVIIDLTVHGPGAVVRSGVKIMDIVPQDEKLVVEAQLAPQDVDQVRIGQTAEVRFSSLRQRELPRIDGKLVQVSADRMIDEVSHQPYFLAKVEIAPEGQAELNKVKLALKPGMPVEVLINTGERTMFQYLTAPLMQSFARSLRER